MRVTSIGKRGFLFTFDEEELGFSTNVYVVDTERHLFVCDTYLGPDPMTEVMNSLPEQKPAIVFNSHSDWDHVWGNCFFGGRPIVAHNRCRESLISEGQKELEKRPGLQLGEVELTLPTVTFNDSLWFHDDGILLFYTPGHTVDSASCLDLKDRVLFAGDNVELPHPYLQSDDLGSFVNTLEGYLELDVDLIIPGHGKPGGKELVRESLAHVKKQMK